MTFNEKIDKFMEENNISTMKQFARNAGIPYTTLRDFYEKKSADNSRLSTIRKISKYMNCSMDYLSYDEIEEYEKKVDSLSTLEKDRLKDQTINEIFDLFEKHGLIDEKGDISKDADKLIDIAVEMKKIYDKKKED